jgi:hypothetical protein
MELSAAVELTMSVIRAVIGTLKRTIADDLMGDVDVPASGAMRFGSLHDHLMC